MKYFLVFVLIIFGLSIYFWYGQVAQKATYSNVASVPSKKISHSESVKEDYIIVPYWTLDNSVSSAPFDNLMYFGVSVDKSGVNVQEDGYKRLEDFKNNSQGKKTFLVVRMLDDEVNLDVLDDKTLQSEIISDAVKVAKEYNFSGIVLDFEIQGIPFEDFVKSITSLNADFAKGAHESDMIFGTFIYGDAYFRARPFDVGEIGKVVDRVYIMAYDFSKARGNPGPNFPLEKDTYGYSFKQMIADFATEVNKQKITVVFGMFGYDWTIDSEGRSKGQATAKSTLEFQKFLTLCVSQESCSISNNSANETKITYQTGQEKHVIWFEDSDSVSQKIKYLNSQGINSVGYWAYNYF